MIGNNLFSRWVVGAVLLAVADCAGVIAVEIALTSPVQAQLFDNRFPFLGRQRPRSGGGGFFGGLFGGGERSNEGPVEQAPVDNSRAPPPRKPDPKAEPVTPTTSVVVLGDGMADWLAYGLEDVFSDSPEVRIVRKNKLGSGLLRYDSKGDLDWWHAVRDILAQEKANYVVMMLGLSDRGDIREKDIAKEAETRAKEQQQTANWAHWIDQRIAQRIVEFQRRYFMSGDEKHPGALTMAIGQFMGENRIEARKELTDAIEELERRLAGKLVELREHLHQSTPGKFPLVKTWREESVVYQGELVSHRGSLWQAQRDTAQPAGGSDWVCVARRGRDAITPVVRGNYDAHECYADSVKMAIEQERQLVDEKLAALEQASNDRWAVIDQRILQHIERARTCAPKH